MLALLAATSLETRNLRPLLSETTPLPGGFAFFLGRIGEQQVMLAHSGIGKANAAACATALLGSYNPAALINLGCGGAYPGAGLKVGDLALATGELMLEEGCATPEGFLDLEALGLPLLKHRHGDLYNRLPVDESLAAEAAACLRDWAGKRQVAFASGPFVTVSTCTGTLAEGERRGLHGAICESMEGAAIALAAARFNCPFLELRGISNLAVQRDTSAWDLSAACRNAEQALLHLLAVWPGSRP